MLIRSQDRKSLYNINTNRGLWISQRSKGFVIVADGFGDMGTYSTEAKAIKVLDMIQMANFRVEKMKMIYSHSGHLSNSCIQDFTFQMPQDKEV
jgi:hypothetical protein